MKQVQIRLELAVFEECPDGPESCTGGDHPGHDVTVETGFASVPVLDLPEAVGRSVAEAGAAALAKLCREVPEFQEALDASVGEHDHVDGAPTPAEPAQLVGDPDQPRSLEEFQELIRNRAGRPEAGGMIAVDVSQMAELAGVFDQLKAATRRAATEGPDPE